MRTDAKIGFAIGGVLLAVLTVYAIVVPKHSKKQGNTVALVKGDTPTGADTPVPQTMLSTDGSAKETPVQPLKDTPINKDEPAKDAKDVSPPHNELVPSKSITPSGPLGNSVAGNDINMGGGADLTRKEPKPGDRTAVRSKPNTKVKPIPSVDTTDTASETDRYYTIQAGQTLSKIAYEVYGNPRCFVAIQRENHGLDPNHLKVGSKIKLPNISLPTDTGGVAEAHPSDRAIKAAEVETAAVPSNGHAYTVQSGDSLYAIARKQLGSGKKSDLIYSLNKDTIGPDKSRLKLGMVLKMPALAE